MSSEETLIISEVFFSLQGEGPYTGMPTAFMRTAGCNLRCLYCDTRYAQESQSPGSRIMSINEILAAITAYPTRRVCITGGEPLLQHDAVMQLFFALDAREYSVSLETNGSCPVEGLPEKLQAIIDVKTPGSGMSGVNNYENLRRARRHFDMFKFVIAEEEDFAWSVEIIKRHRLDRRYRCFVSPATGLIEASWLAEMILKSGLDISLNTQLHKQLWPEAEKGR